MRMEKVLRRGAHVQHRSPRPQPNENENQVRVQGRGLGGTEKHGVKRLHKNTPQHEHSDPSARGRRLQNASPSSERRENEEKSQERRDPSKTR